MDDRIENYISENSALRSKLNAKSEALKILAKELDKCRTERDQFKLMAEQIQERYTYLKKKSANVNLYSDSGSSNVAQLLEETREYNKFLKLELEATKQCLIESRGDIQVLRRQLQSTQQKNGIISEDVFPVHQREELVEQLEKMSTKTSQMRGDIQALLDEKEELIKERDAFKHKAHRVSHELAIALSVSGKDDENSTQSKSSTFLIDADALISENRYLHERLKQADVESQLAVQALAKCKNMLESKRPKGIVKFGTIKSDYIMSHKQVKQLLEDGAELPITATTIADLKSLCLSLLEALSDKTIALAHKRKTNKILAGRVVELESKLEKVYPSYILLENYNSAEADKQDVSEELNRLDSLSDCTQTSTAISTLDSGPNNSEPTDSNLCIEEEVLKLPPKLQQMVDKALEELKNEIGEK